MNLKASGKADLSRWRISSFDFFFDLFAELVHSRCRSRNRFICIGYETRRYLVRLQREWSLLPV